MKDLQTKKARLSRPSRLKRYASDLAGFATTVLAAAAMLAGFAIVAWSLAYFARFN